MSEEWCDFYDMPKAQCAHCQNGDQIPERLSPKQHAALGVATEIRRAIAEFESMCTCGSRVLVGEPVRWNGHRWVHEECIHE